MKTDFDCQILADSINSVTGDRVTSFEVTFPRFILAEVNTHRTASRNSASSRAIPVRKRLKAIAADPFVPLAFTKNQSGMQASEVLNDVMGAIARTAWLGAAKAACAFAGVLDACGVHKQHANRLVEPFAWQTAIVSATEWKNFYALRCHPDAQPEFQVIASMMEASVGVSEPEKLAPGQWHLPMLRPEELAKVRAMEEAGGRGPYDVGAYPSQMSATERSIARWVKISAGRCARVSYLTHDADVALCDRLQTSGHMSPLEHPAMACDWELTTYPVGSREWKADPYETLRRSPRHGNYTGFKQYRKFLANEAIFGGSNGAE